MQPSLLLSSAILLFLFASLGSSSTDEGLGAAVLPPASEASSSSTASSARPQPDPSNLVIPEPGLGNLTASNETLSSSNLTASNSSLWENGTSSTSTTTTTTTAMPVDPILPHILLVHNDVGLGLLYLPTSSLAFFTFGASTSLNILNNFSRT
ncbi:hypothetical protein TYRP_003546 [Tyrophagus putrescentiae]|nr:hypothetical protein TYRP_003546 [Tyrophagus putrescentiae]